MATPKRPALDDRDLARIHFSPVCTYCAHWLPGDGHHCAGAFPRGGPEIPDVIWNGVPGKASGYFHTRPVAGDHGVVFTLAEGVKRTPANAKLLDAYLAAQQGEKPH